MERTNGYTSFLTALLVLFALVYPYVHIFDHGSYQNIDIEDHSHFVQLDKNLVTDNMDCKICDFHFSGFDDPEFLSFDLYIPTKETIYSLSLTQTVWHSPDPYFSLRAPPAYRI